MQEAIPVIEVEYTYKRADGCSGSAVKGIQALLIPPPSTASFSYPSPSPALLTHDCDSGATYERAGYLHKPNEMNLHRIIITSVGYDQRLTLWHPRPFPPTLVPTVAHVSLNIASDDKEVFIHEDNTEEDPEKALFLNVEDITRTRDELLEWVTGLAIHIGDVCALDTCLVSSSSGYQSTANDCEVNDGSCNVMAVPYGTTRKANLDDTEITMIVVGEGFQLLTATI